MIEHDQDTAGLRDVWGWALSWFRKPPPFQDKRDRQAAIVTAILHELRLEPTVPDLHHRYRDGNHWALLVARRACPEDWPTLGVHACTAAAYGLRYVELATGAAIDPHHLPAWLGEFAIW